MAKCHNCGRETLRTEDWACQWCGHPLLYGPFKKIEKTYKQLKDERINKSVREEEAGWELKHELETEKEMEPKQDLEVIKGIELEPEPEKVKETDVAQGIEQEIEIEEETEPVQEPERELEKTEIEECEPEIKTEIEKETEAMQEPAPADMELDVAEILTAYEEDDIAADEKFVNKILRVTGTVSLIDIKDKLDVHYIRLTGSGGDPWLSLQCMFDKKHLSALEQLEKGHNVTVQGRYSGSIIAIRMVDCVLVF